MHEMDGYAATEKIRAPRDAVPEFPVIAMTAGVDTIDPDVVHMAELFAAQAAIALGRARREEQLNTAMQTRKGIGQAIGILMERHNVNEDHAFAYLTHVSSHANIKLRDIAKEIVALRNDQSHALDVTVKPLPLAKRMKPAARSK